MIGRVARRLQSRKRPPRLAGCLSNRAEELFRRDMSRTGRSDQNAPGFESLDSCARQATIGLNRAKTLGYLYHGILREAERGTHRP